MSNATPLIEPRWEGETYNNNRITQKEIKFR
jgi:hypothetical protein